jgi:hypothetical protein
MKIALWTAQSLLAALFLMAGATKALTPHADLAAQMPWVLDTPPWLPAMIGVAEIAGALGLVLPAATGIRPRLTPLAAGALALVMALATGLHVARGEAAALALTLPLLCLAAFVAWGRTRRLPIAARRSSAAHPVTA